MEKKRERKRPNAITVTFPTTKINRRKFLIRFWANKRNGFSLWSCWQQICGNMKANFRGGLMKKARQIKISSAALHNGIFHISSNYGISLNIHEALWSPRGRWEGEIRGTCDISRLPQNFKYFWAFSASSLAQGLWRVFPYFNNSASDTENDKLLHNYNIAWKRYKRRAF